MGAPKPDFTASLQQQQQQQGSGGGGFGRVLAEGMAFGAGSAVASRMVDSVMGPRTVNVRNILAFLLIVCPLSLLRLVAGRVDA